MNSKIKYIVALAVVIATLGGAYYFFAKPILDEKASVVEEVMTNKDVSLTFAYPSGQNAFALLEPEGNEMIKKTFVLMRTQDYIKLRNDGFVDTETPPSITILVFPQSEDYSVTGDEETGKIAKLQNWAMKNQNITAFDAVENTPEVVDIDGVATLKYTADGLYMQDIYLASYRENIYMFVGQYSEQGDDMYKTFEKLMTTVYFE